MTERRRPHRRGRRPPGNRQQADSSIDSNPYRDAEDGSPSADGGLSGSDTTPSGGENVDGGSEPSAEMGGRSGGDRPDGVTPAGEGGDASSGGTPAGNSQWQGGQQQRSENGRRNGRRGRRGRFRDRGGDALQQGGPTGGFTPQPIVADGETTGWFDVSRDGGFVRRAQNSYLGEPGDAWVQPAQMRQFGLRRGDNIVATTGKDHRGRIVLVDVQSINDEDPSALTKRPDFSGLVASYPERKLTLETGRAAKAGPELTRRALDLIAPIGYGQRALIVAPARAGKTMLMHAVTEGIALNHPEAVLLILLVDERPEEVSEAISWGVGEVIASSFDQPAKRHVEVTEMVLERARRLVELGRDVVIVLDSLTRMARAHNTAERGTGRTMSGGLDSSAMAKPKAFFGSARYVLPDNGGGSLTIIATALVETGSRMDDVIFEEFKGTGNCEIKLDRSLAEKRIYPAIDIATSGTRREDKLFRPDQLEHVHMLRRGLGQMPPQAGMEWLAKRIANTPNNDALLEGL